MAFMGFCEGCHHLKVSVSYEDLLVFFIDHSVAKHNGKETFHISHIPARAYQDYLEHKENPVFWRAWRLSKKPKIPFFCGGYRGD